MRTGTEVEVFFWSPGRGGGAGRTAGFAAAAAASVAAGAAALSPRIGLVALALAAALVVAATREGALWWGVFLAALGGALVLGFSFSNIGVHVEGIPIPLADILLALLLARMFVGRDRLLRPSPPLLLAGMFVVVAGARLLFDLGDWGYHALRDATFPAEVLYLFVGYWMMRAHGVGRWTRPLGWIFVVTLAYFALYPWAAQVQAASPTIGLRRPVPLLGVFQGFGPAAAAGLFFMAIVRPFGRRSIPLAALFLVPIAILQLRGLFLAVPVALVLVWLASGRGRGVRVRSGLAATILAGTLAVAVLFPFAPEGRRGPTSGDFLASQLGTLVGQEGPGARTIRNRVRWFQDVWEKVGAERGTIVFGLGLGPDLAEGFESKDDIAVRKPHNDFLEVFARLGIPGLALLLGVLVLAVGRIYAAVRVADPPSARFLLWVLATTTVYVAMAATQPLMAYSYGTIPLFAALGAGLAVADERPPEDAGQPDRRSAIARA